MLGVDGVGIPYIVATDNPMEVYRNTNAAGTGAWSVVTTIDLPNISLPTIDKDRAILLTDDKPAFVCHVDLDTYFVKSTSTSAAGPWIIIKVNAHDHLALTPDTLSINFSDGDKPHIFYIHESGFGIVLHIVQALGETSF